MIGNLSPGQIIYCEVSMRSLNLDIQRSSLRWIIHQCDDRRRRPQNGSIQSAQYSDLPVRWTRRKWRTSTDHRGKSFSLHSEAAIRPTEKYAQEKGTLLFL